MSGQENGKSALERVRDWLDPVLGPVRRALEGFERARGSEAAASLAYYALFSLFPLLLVLTSGAGYFLESDQAYAEAMNLISEAFPTFRGIIERNIQQVLEVRGTVGILGLAGLLWSALGVFGVLAVNLSRAYPDAAPRGFLRQRLVGLVMVGVLAVLLLASVLTSAAESIVPQLDLPALNGLQLVDTMLWPTLTNLVSIVLIFLMFLAMYRWVPHSRDATWRGALWGAGVAAVAWEIAASVFAWVLSSGLVEYELIYGSLGTVVSLMLWIYISAVVTLFGAHLSAAISRGSEEDDSANVDYS